MADEDKEGTVDKGNAATNYITKEDFASALKDQQTRIAGAMDIFGDQVSSAILNIRGKEEGKDGGKGAPEGGNKSDSSGVRDEAVALIEDPDAYISRLIDKKMANNEDMDTIRNDMFIDRINELQGEYDEEYGEGSFKEQILPDLIKAAGELPPKMRASKSHMQMLSRGIKGGIPADKLVEKRLAAKKAQEERTAPAMLRGVGAPRSQGDKLDGDESSWLASLDQKGVKYSKEEYLKDRKLGSDIDAIVEAARK